MAVTPQAIEVVIEELVLHGFEDGDRLAIADALEAELMRLLGQGGLGNAARGSISLERVQAGSFRVAPGTQAATIGRETAKAVHHGLSSAAAEALPAGESALRTFSPEGKKR